MNETDLREQFSMQYDAEHKFPFIEDENCNIHGYGHQDKAEFAAAVNRYDLEVGGVDPEDADWTAEYVTHKWAVMDADGERFWVMDALRPVTSATPGAFPITCLWNVR